MLNIAIVPRLRAKGGAAKGGVRNGTSSEAESGVPRDSMDLWYKEEVRLYENNLYSSIRGARQKYGSNSTYFRGTPLFVAYYRDQISRIYASSTAALVQNLAVFALEKIGKSSRSLSIGILKNSKKRNDSCHGTNHFSQGPPNTTHIWARDQFSVQTRAQIWIVTRI